HLRSRYAPAKQGAGNLEPAATLERYRSANGGCGGEHSRSPQARHRKPRLGNLGGARTGSRLGVSLGGDGAAGPSRRADGRDGRMRDERRLSPASGERPRPRPRRWTYSDRSAPKRPRGRSWTQGRTGKNVLDGRAEGSPHR